MKSLTTKQYKHKQSRNKSRALSSVKLVKKKKEGLPRSRRVVEDNTRQDWEDEFAEDSSWPEAA